MLPTPEAILSALAKPVAPHLVKMISSVGKKEYNKFIALYTNVFNGYMVATTRKCATTKNVLYRDSAVDLASQYVSNELIQEGVQLTDEYLLGRAKSHPIRALITGHAGSGKSMLTKWLSLELSSSILYHQKIPIFVEARAIPRSQLLDPLELTLFNLTSTSKSNVSLEQFKMALEYGAFVIILDGLDEISLDERDRFLTEISKFEGNFGNTALICSSRPDRRIEYMVSLSVYQLSPMSKAQVINVINKLRFDDDKKIEFVTELRSGLYERHQTFLSNPLLCIIMLIQFDVALEVPKKISIFYGQVYETLFFKHDTAKGIYTREHRSKLSIDRFETVFQLFCFLTYSQNMLRFSYSDIITHFRKCLSISKNKAVSPEEYLTDCMQSLSMLLEEGLDITFVHRSFQEYFCARHILFYRGAYYEEILDRLVPRSGTDRVLSLLYEMDGVGVRRNWVYFKLRAFCDQYANAKLKGPLSVLSLFETNFKSVLVDMSNNSVAETNWSEFASANQLLAALSLIDEGNSVDPSNVFENMNVDLARKVGDGPDSSPNSGRGISAADMQGRQIISFYEVAPATRLALIASFADKVSVLAEAINNEALEMEDFTFYGNTDEDDET